MSKFLTFKNKEKGFTLIETFVAVLILVIAVIGPLGLLSRAIADGNYAKNQVTAYYLAQEKMEEIINQRDRNIKNGDGWLYNIDNIKGKDCVIGENDNCLLYLQEDDDITFYTEDVNDKSSLFKRSWSLRNTNDDSSAEVIITVTWRNKEVYATPFVLKTVIYNPSYVQSE